MNHLSAVWFPHPFPSLVELQIFFFTLAPIPLGKEASSPLLLTSFSLWLPPSPPLLVSLSTGCVRVWQSFWNNVRVNNTWTHRMSVLNVKTMIFQRKVRTESTTWSRGQIENSQYTKTWSKRRVWRVGWMLNISSLSAVATGGMLCAKLTSWPCMRVLHWYLMHKHFSHVKSLQCERPFTDVMVPKNHCHLILQTQVIRCSWCFQWWWSDLWTSSVHCWRCWTTRRSVPPPLTRWPPYATSWTRCRCQVQSEISHRAVSVSYPTLNFIICRMMIVILHFSPLFVCLFVRCQI